MPSTTPELPGVGMKETPSTVKALSDMMMKNIPSTSHPNMFMTK